MELEFHERMLDLYRQTKAEVASYNPLGFLQMVVDESGLMAAQKLLDAPDISDGFSRLWEAKRLDLSVEAVIIDEGWGHQFTPEQLAVARERLTQARYSFRRR